MEATVNTVNTVTAVAPMKGSKIASHVLNIQKNGVEKLLIVLKAMDAKYKIILPDGTTYGELEVADPKKTRRRTRSKNAPGNRYQRGETMAYYKPLLVAIPPGGAEAVPFDRFHPPTLAQNINAYAHFLWGAGNYSATRNDKNKTVDVLRYK